MGNLFNVTVNILFSKNWPLLYEMCVIFSPVLIFLQDTSFIYSQKRLNKTHQKTSHRKTLKYLSSFSFLYGYFWKKKKKAKIMMDLKISDFIDNYKLLNWINTYKRNLPKIFKDLIYTFLFFFSVKWLSCAKDSIFI